MDTFDFESMLSIFAAIVIWYLLKKITDYFASKLDKDIQSRYHFPSPFSFIISILLIVAFVVLFGFIPSFYSHVFPSCQMLIKMQSTPLLNLLLLIAGSIMFSWMLAKFQRNMFTYGGFGTSMFVSGEETQPKIGTKWLVMLLIPVLPVQSYEIEGTVELSIMQTEYQMTALDSIDYDQVRETIRNKWWIYTIVLIAIIALSILFIVTCV